MDLHTPVSRRRGGCLTKLLFLMLLGVGVLALCWVLFLPMLVVRSLHDRTGFDVSVQDISANPFTARISVKGLVIANPSAYPINDFVHIGEFTADAEFLSLFSDRLVVEEAVVDIRELALVRNAQGERNALVFWKALVGESGPAQPAASVQQEKTPVRKEFLIRKLRLRLDRLVISDGVTDNTQVRKVDLQFSQDYENVTGVAQVTEPIIRQAIAKSGALKELTAKALESFKTNGASLKETGQKAVESIKGFFQSLGEKGKN
jgi:uncharacterized protein involved in outer membrane biogenesis